MLNWGVSLGHKLLFKPKSSPCHLAEKNESYSLQHKLSNTWLSLTLQYLKWFLPGQSYDNVKRTVEHWLFHRQHHSMKMVFRNWFRVHTNVLILVGIVSKYSNFSFNLLIVIAALILFTHLIITDQHFKLWSSYFRFILVDETALD